MINLPVLIPFKAGQWFKRGDGKKAFDVVSVLIPFKAGQWFKRSPERLKLIYQQS